MQRRSFIKNTALSLAGVGLAPTIWGEEECRKKSKIGIQLYTLRNEMEKNLDATIAALVGLGYKNLEHAGYKEGKFYGKTPSEFKKILINEGVKVTSGHVLTGRDNPTRKGTLINDFERLVADMKAIGQTYIVCAWLFPEERTCLADYEKLTDILNKSGEICNKYGITFAYHNHDFEFSPIQTIIPYDLMLRDTEESLVKYEMDMYWMQKSNRDPLAYFDKHPKRFPLWHIKDMARGEEQRFAEVGSGIIDFQRIFAGREKAGLKQFYVEQDNCYERLPIDSVKMSIDYLKGQTWV